MPKVEILKKKRSQIIIDIIKIGNGNDISKSIIGDDNEH